MAGRSLKARNCRCRKRVIVQGKLTVLVIRAIINRFYHNFIILNNLQRRVSALIRHLQDEYKGVYIMQCHKMDEISFTESSELLKRYY
jgi:translation elongation factor EF-1alpha